MIVSQKFSSGLAMKQCDSGVTLEFDPDRLSAANQTPVNAKPLPWSPCFHATTPDLNGLSAQGTPALQLSLGINPDLDSSWMSSMATPTSSDVSFQSTSLCNNACYTPGTSEGRIKALQRRSLFQFSNMDENRVTTKTTSLQQIPEEQPGILVQDSVTVASTCDLSSVISNLVKIPPVKFVYPNPVPVHVSDVPNSFSGLQAAAFSSKAFSDDESEDSCQVLRQKHRDVCNSLYTTGEHPTVNHAVSSLSDECERQELPTHSHRHRVMEKLFEASHFKENTLASATSCSMRVKDREERPINRPSEGKSFNEHVENRKATESIRLKPSECQKVSLQPEDHLRNSLSGLAGGFNTARGVAVQISERALNRAQALFDSLDSGQPLPEHLAVSSSPGCDSKGDRSTLPASKEIAISAAVGFSTAKGKIIPVTKESMARAERLFEEVDCPSPDISAPKNGGFSTAGGKTLAVSKDAISRAAKMFEEVDEPLSEQSPKIRGASSTSAIQFSVGKKQLASIHVAKEQVQVNEAASSVSSTTPKLSEATVNRRSLPVARKALVRAAKLFDKEEAPSSSSVDVAVSQIVGFSTGRGKSIQISEEAMTRAAKRFEEIEEPEGKQPLVNTCSKAGVAGYDETPKALGFSTASGKNVRLSDCALNRARKLFEEDLTSDTLQDLVAVSPDSQKRLDPPPHSPPQPAIMEHRKRKVPVRQVEEMEEEDERSASPTIGMKKRKMSKSSPRSKPLTPLTPVMGTPSAFENSPTCVDVSALIRRRKAREEQKSIIDRKRTKAVRVVAEPGRLYRIKTSAGLTKTKWRELVGQSFLPEPCQPYRLLDDYGMTTSVCLVTPGNAASFHFYAWEYGFSVKDCRSNWQGFKLGEFSVILSDDNTIGCEEIGTSLLALPSVDPTLISVEWIRNHYRWIVWKLASMEIKLPAVFARQALTPLHVLEQLKYRYDVEIDKCCRSTLKRIVEQDDTPAKTMILCVVDVKTPSILELTDGWYSIDAHCDPGLQNVIAGGKIFIGLKLVIAGAELASPGPTTPLEKGCDTFLKISANSTRRARWDAKLGVFARPLPFPIGMRSILPDGGLIAHVRVTVARVYPLVYMEKMADGKKVFHSERQYRRISEGASIRYERLMEKMMEEIERQEDEQERKRSRGADGKMAHSNLTDEEKRNKIHAEVIKRMEGISGARKVDGLALMRLRVIDWRNKDPTHSAIVSVWRPNEDVQHHLKENRSYHLYSVSAGGLRFGELQLNSSSHTVWKEMKDDTNVSSGFERTVTALQTAGQPGFKPLYHELDVVGLVVYVAQQQTKGPFQTVVLSDGSHYFGVKCWGSLEDHALADVVVTGTFLAFANLQWRTTASRQTSNLPFAFIHEGTYVSSRPVHKHLDAALGILKQTISDAVRFVGEVEGYVLSLLGSSTPQSSTPKSLVEVSGRITPTGTADVAAARKDTPVSTNSLVNRARLLEKYGNPPPLTAYGGTSSPLVRQKFKPPARKTPAPAD